MAYRVLRSQDAIRDLDLLFDHLYQSYVALGETSPSAFEHAARRIDTVRNDMASLALAPRQGSLVPELVPGVRQVTKNRAIFYFRVDEAEKTILVLAIFFGGQDHRRRLLLRLWGGR